ncbi:hypothetical protein AB3466_17735 [Sphingobacterium thalpophilum]|uniref:hypothetical protein n=1 Tax=Sphingobacterium thalpophilum TaxID=259 RepID=UPI0037D9FA22
MGNTFGLEIQEARNVPTDRKYWFIRTFGGQLFNYFYEREKVGIIGNSVPLDYIKNGRYDNATFTTLQQFIFNNEVQENQSEATKLANQLLRFYHDVKIGDVVMMPSADSNYIAIGLIDSDIKIEKTTGTVRHNDKDESYPEKIRKVKWQKILPKNEVVGDLRSLFSSRLGLTNADKYGDFIESNLSSVFIKDEMTYGTFYINQDENINAFELKRFLDAITTLYTELCKENGYDVDEELYIKIKVQSKGSAILIGGCVGAITAIIVYLGLFSNNLELKAKAASVLDIDIKYDGNALDAYNRYKSEDADIDYKKDSLARKSELEQLRHKIDVQLLQDSLNKIQNNTLKTAVKELADSSKHMQTAPIESSEKSLAQIKKD